MWASSFVRSVVCGSVLGFLQLEFFPHASFHDQSSIFCSNCYLEVQHETANCFLQPPFPEDRCEVKKEKNLCFDGLVAPFSVIKVEEDFVKLLEGQLMQERYHLYTSFLPYLGVPIVGQLQG